MPIKDDYELYKVGLESPGIGGADVTANDSADLPFRPRGITCQVSGTIRVQWADGTTSNHSIAAGSILPLRPNRIHATGTTATGLAIVK